MQIDLIKASREQYETLHHLLELYLYELAPLFKQEIGPDGCYGYEHLPLYFQDPKRFPFLIWIDEKLGGFALVHQGSSYVDSQQTYEITELFLLPKYRGKGIGRKVVLTIWKMFPGDWQIRSLKGNTKACQFWSKLASQFPTESGPIAMKQLEQDKWTIYHLTPHYQPVKDSSNDDAKLKLHRDLDQAG